MKKHILIIGFIIAFALQGFSQDPHFSQFYANPLYLNPAFAGTQICPRLCLNHRTQWLNIPGYYHHYSMSYDFHKDYLSGGLGIMVNHDREGGVYQTNSISGMYSYNLRTGPNLNFKAGFEARLFQKKLDRSNLNFGDQIDPEGRFGFIYETEENFNENSTWGPDFSAGLLMYNRSWFVGAAVHHLTRPDEGIIGKSYLPRKLTAHVGTIIDVNARLIRGNRMRRRLEDPTISPNIIYQLQENLEQLNYGFYYTKYPLILGLWYRHSFNNSDMIAGLVGFRTPIMKFGYSYDMTISKLSVETGGSHEISCSFKLPCRPEKKRIKVIQCPSF